MARLQGMFARKVPLSATVKYNGRPVLIDSELDFQLIHSSRVAFVDCKSFSGEARFVYSELEEHQRKLAADLNYHGVPAGFCIWFRAIDAVVFFTGEEIEAKGPGSAFEWGEGILLGRGLDFDLHPIFAYPERRKARQNS